MSFKLKEAKYYTLLLIQPDWKQTEFMEIKVLSFDSNSGDYRIRHQTNCYLHVSQDYIDSGLIFEGADLPIYADTGVPYTEGTNTFNLVCQNPFQLIEFILKNCLNPTPEKLQKIRWRSPVQGVPLFPQSQ